MRIFPADDANLPTQLWIAARYLQSLSFLSAVLLIRQKINQRFLVGVFSVVTILLLAAIASGAFPDCYVNGLTPFKKISEYIISLILAVAILRLRWEREAFNSGIFALITLSAAFTILAELAFTFYVDVYGLSNFLGHIFKILAIYCIYKSVIETGLNQPFDLLFHDMKKREVELENSQNLLHEIATHDPLTGLPNRLLFEARLSHALEKAQRNHFSGKQSMVQLIIMDVDDFKNINDMLGHLGGDDVLREIGRRLKAGIRESDTVARWGGDEFTCVLEDILSIEDASHAAQKLLTSMTLPMLIQGQELGITVSLGYSLFPVHSQQKQVLLRYADTALYRAKETKNSYRIYEESMDVFSQSMLGKPKVE
jgi:diguanylate cyclase (GGDEF)-like protein